MQFGASIAIFIALAFGLLTLFCLVTKYFQYKMNKMAKQQGQAYSQIDGVSHRSDQDIEGQYDNYLENRKLNEPNSAKKTKTQYDYLLELTQIQTPLKNDINPIYGVSQLRKRLDGQVAPLKTQTGRSLPSVRSFRPERLNTGRSAESSNRQVPSNSNRKQDLNITHEFISKLISYTEEGIKIIDVNINALKRENSKIIEKKTVKETNIMTTDESFEDQLEVLGFQKNKFSCFKVKSKVQIPQMKEKQDYLLQNFQVSSSKQEIDFSQFYMLKDKAESL